MSIFNSLLSNTNLITAFATVVVAIATLYYAITNHKLWKSLDKERKHRKYVDEVNYLIKPFIEQSDTQLRILEGQSFYWYVFRNEPLLSGYDVHKTVKIIFNNFLKKHNKIYLKIQKHNYIVNKIKENYKKILEDINEKNLKIKIKEYVKKFEQNPKHKTLNKLGVEQLPNVILHHIIAGTDINDNNFDEPFKSFWKEYGEIFLNMRKEGNIKIYFNNIIGFSRDLIELCKFIRDNLQEILDEYIIKYDISIDEIEGKTVPKGEFVGY